jgi:predicted RNase H-like HicB family nuclease
MDKHMTGHRRKKTSPPRRSPDSLLDEAIELVLEMIQDGKQRLEEAGSTAEWVKLAGALGQAEARLAQLLAAQAKFGEGISEFEQALMQAIREWHERNTPSDQPGERHVRPSKAGEDA